MGVKIPEDVGSIPTGMKGVYLTTLDRKSGDGCTLQFEVIGKLFPIDFPFLPL